MDRLINVFVTILLIEMMAAIGLGVTMAELLGVARSWRLLLGAALANYVLFPAATVALLFVFRPPDPTVPAGFLILAVCPGAPFGPPCTRIAGGNVTAAVGLMAVLAGSSALAAPALLHFLLPLISGGGELHVDAVKVVGSLLVTQLLPLSLGLWVRHRRPGLAARLKMPADRLSAVLSLGAVGLVLHGYSHLLLEIRLRGYVAMLALLLSSLLSGWLLGGRAERNRRALALTTSLRNVGVALVIATGSFAGTAAVTAVLAYGIVEILGSVLCALAWGRRPAAPA